MIYDENNLYYRLAWDELFYKKMFEIAMEIKYREYHLYSTWAK